MTETQQLELVDELAERCAVVEEQVTAIEGTLGTQVEANPDDKLLLEMLDMITDAQEMIAEFRDTLDVMRTRDEAG